MENESLFTRVIERGLFINSYLLNIYHMFTFKPRYSWLDTTLPDNGFLWVLASLMPVLLAKLP